MLNKDMYMVRAVFKCEFDIELIRNSHRYGSHAIALSKWHLDLHKEKCTVTMKIFLSKKKKSV